MDFFTKLVKKCKKVILLLKKKGTITRLLREGAAATAMRTGTAWTLKGRAEDVWLADYRRSPRERPVGSTRGECSAVFVARHVGVA